MAAQSELSPTSYIQHHLTFLTKPVKDGGGFWTVNVDTMVTTLVLGALCFGFLWWITRKATSGVPSKTQAFVELAIGFVDNEVRSVYQGTSRLVAPLALTTFVLVLFMNAMDFLPVDIMSWIYHNVFHQET
ncbi:MAG TPA: F0F1 ATP synthase subunit A, partial [Casimicrobiaceae bacterium]|nr:F0F1 ATP synthase subunit A [Casimicrobiaceae bacterium]